MKFSISTSIILIATAVFPVAASNNPYEVNANGCVNYPQGRTDDDCQNGSNLGLFDGNRYRHSYTCTEGGGYACCASTIENQSNVQDLGQCIRNYQPNDSGCIPYDGGNNDDGCFNNSEFHGFDYSYRCTEGKPYICCDSNVDNLSNVQNQGQCQRNTSRRNLRRRA